MFGKKRRDKKRDPSTFQRLYKAGNTALALGAGAVFLHNSKLGEKFFREVTPALLESKDTFKKDFSKINKRSLLEISNTFEKSFGDENFQKTLLRKKEEKMKLNQNSSSIYRQLLGKRQILEASSNDLESELANNYKKNVMEYTAKKIHKEQIAGKRDDIKLSHVSQIIESVFDDISENSIESEIIEDKINKVLKKTSLNKKETYDILTAINSSKEELYKSSKINAYIKENKALKDQIDEIYYSSNLIEFNKSKYDKFDKFIKTVLKGNVKSEEIINNSQPVFIKEFLDNIEEISKYVDVEDFEFKTRKENKKNSKESKIFNFVDELKLLVEKNKDAENLIVSKGLRKTTDEEGNITYFSTQDNIDYLDKIKNKLKETLPYKVMFKFFDDKSQDKNIFISRQGFKSSIVSHMKLTGQETEKTLEGLENNMTSSLSFFINGKTYLTTEKDGILTIDKNNQIESKLLRGYKKKEYYSILGKQDYIYPEAYGGRLAQLLDINQDGELNIFNVMKRALHKFDDKDWEFNSLENVETAYTSGLNILNYADIILSQSLTSDEYEDTHTYQKTLVSVLNQLHKDERVTSEKLNQNIKGVTNQTLETLLQSDLLSDKSKNMINALLDENINDYLNAAIHSDYDSHLLADTKNDKLNILLNKWLTNTNEMINSKVDIKSKGFRIPFLEMPFDESNQLDIFGQLRIETVKNVMLELNGDLNGDKLLNWIDDLNLTKKETYTLKDMVVSTLFDKDTKINSVGDYTQALGTLYNNNNFPNLLSDNPLLRSHFEANIGTAKSKFGPLSKGSTYNLNQKYYKTEEDYAIIKRSSIGKILTFDLNEGIKFNAEAAKDTARELIAGRNNPQDITDLTLNIRHLYSRLNYGMQEIGLGLSDESLGSTPDVIKNIMLKRVLPIMAVGKGLDVLNYESRKLTGVSLSGAVANSVANVDLGIRGILDATHLSGPLNYLAETSVISEYYSGDRKFKTKEEEQQWYEDGYSPVRKGRFWSFGSSSEYRGGDITYFQPNFLKRAHSNYHDVSVYGSEDDKWVHSFIPTPQHPLSPIRAILDPYWLERKHLKDNDRPYPLTAKMFSEGTFWGSVLNPTIGQALKPVKMLPEAKRRLGKNGIDTKSSIERLNTKIKQRKNRKDDLVIIEGTDIRNGEYVPYGNPESDEVNLSIQNGRLAAKGTNYINAIDDISNYEAPDGLSFTQEQNNYQGKIYRKQQRILSKSKKFFQDMQNVEYSDETGTNTAISIIEKLNTRIKKRSKPTRNINTVINTPNKNEGTFIYRNLANERLSNTEDYYERYDTKDMVNKSVYSDYRKDFMYSQKQIHGIYGFLAEQMLGSKSYTYRYENAGKMSSFTRSFWDANLGGLGGGVMEIARRFFPSEDRSRVSINPLRNNMPDWIPDSYHMGDPYTEIPKGEMRLPGKGYESLNKLHSDSFGTYGAFDRYKILADIAPNSTEYKKWRSIALNTVNDPNLKKQMEDISVRVAKMSGNHEFYNYNYIHTNTVYKKGIVKNINNGQITLTDNTVLSLAGLVPTENTDEGLKQLLTPGQKINYKTYKDVKINENGDPSVESVVYNLEKHNQNVNQQLIENGAADKNKEDFSPLAVAGKQSGTQEVLGAIQEIIAHAKIPVLHNKFLRVETPLESYKNETYYGSNFKTWDHPIKGFIIPAFNEQSGKGIINEALSVGYAILHFSKIAGKTDSKLIQYASNTVLSTLNPTAFIGGSLGFASRLSMGKILSSGESNLSDFQVGAKIGVTLGAIKWGTDNADNPIKAMASFGFAGASASKIFVDIEPFIKKVFNKDIEKFGMKEGALVGALTGLAVSALKNPDFDKERMFRSKWASKETRKKWDLDEYFDRLNYLKYKGLYQVASARAAIFEHSNIREIFKDIDKNKKELAKLNRKRTKLIEKDKGKNKNQLKIIDIDQQRLALQEQNKNFFTAKKYTKSAIAYKKKMESTIYGLDETATKDELLASVPDQYKDHFKAFMDVTDKSERKEILKYVPKYLQRPLQVAWGQKPNKVQSNRTYFKNHKLPSMAWKGWKPNVNLKHVKMKTIQNEGMLLSDFGYYDSEKSKPTYASAPDIKNFDKRSGQFYRTNMLAVMHGMGINQCNVSVEPTSAPGLWIAGDIKDTSTDILKASSYKVGSLVQTLSSNII